MNKCVWMSVLAAGLLLGACDRGEQKEDATPTEPKQAEETGDKKQGQEAAPEEEEPSAAFFVDPGAETPEPVTKAVAVLHPTEGNEAMGTVTFEVTEGGGLKYESSFKGLPDKKHAHHVHLLGDCTGADGTSAGTHFNLAGSSKNPPKDIDRITGDLGNVEVGEDGTGEASGTLDKGALQGPYSILGRAVIIHVNPNDPSQPPIGAAGGRLACGVIGLTE